MPSWLEHVWLERYLDRKLTAAETAWFDRYMLDKPRLIAAIGNDTALRNGHHPWHAEQGSATDVMDEGGAPGDEQAVKPKPRSRARDAWFRPLLIAAAIVLAAVFGASAVRWIIPAKTSVPEIASPNRIVFDTLRGSASAPLVDRTADSSAPLLIDIAVPIRAAAVVAHFSDQSSLPLPISADGFVSLAGPRDAMLAKSPIRITWMLDGESQERQVDIGAAIDNEEG